MKPRSIAIARSAGWLTLVAASFIPPLAREAGQEGTGSLEVVLDYTAAPGCPQVARRNFWRPFLFV